ncbi:MAG: homoserine dehydrogenase [Oscillospiraceae bacterium]|jgi:homoserine dehydrogenase|nr:homoserine dehydrogenase [Oscillospiraceae bacterium]
MAKIAVCGYGVVGKGVAEVLTENADSISRNAAEDISLKYILDIREFPGDPFEKLFVHDFSIIEKDPEVTVVVETMGGVGAAFDFTKRALLSGKSVVTSNKELVAKFGHELIAIAKERNLNYLFEASVGGGIPIIRPITQCLAANRLDSVYGILNGTTNYILTEMIQNNASFEDALHQAQANGFAEADPTADVEGLDAARKICILSDLCFGRHIDPEGVRTQGITGVSLTDVEYAKRLNCKIKLLGRGLRTGADSATAFVAPHLVSVSSLLSNVDGVMNGIVVHGNALGDAMFYGAGAGARPTASAVVADVIDAVKHSKARKYLDWLDAPPGYFTDSCYVRSRWYVRAETSLQQIGWAFGKVNFVTYPGASTTESAFATEEYDERTMQKLTSGMNVKSMFRILD